MNLEKSGNIYLIPLEYNLGYTVGMFMDFSDISPFDGCLMYIFDIKFDLAPKNFDNFNFENVNFLFGPMVINLPPNIRGKNSWKLILKSKKINKKIPVFKSTQHSIKLHKAIDWSTVPEWHKLESWNKRSNYIEYENIRSLETTFLYDKRDISIRTTMHYLMKMGKNVKDYYDLSIGRFDELYLLHLNTTFNKTEAEAYFKEYEKIRRKI